MPKGEIINANTNGFDKNPQNINKDGRPPSLKKKILELIQKDGSIKFKKEQVKKIHDDGSVSIMLPTSDALMIKLISMAGSGNIKALQILLEYVDGKGQQSIEISQTELPKLKVITIGKND